MKICNECGTQLPEDVDMCPSCGAPTELPVTLEEATENPVEETYEEVYEETYEEVYETEPENQVLEPIMDEGAYAEYEATAEEYVEEYVEPETYTEAPVYQEPMYTEPVAPAIQPMPQPKKQGGVPIFVVVILLLLTLAISLLIGYVVFGNKEETPKQPDPVVQEPVKENEDKDKDKEEDNKDEEKENEEKEDNKDEEKEPTTETETGPTKKVVIDSYEFKIPTDDMEYKADKDKIELSDKDKGWTANIKTTNSIYSLLVDKKDELKDKFEAGGYKVNEYGTKEYDGYEILVFEVTEASGYNMFLAYSYLGSARVAVYSIYSMDNKYDYDVLKEVVKVVKNATPNTSTQETSNTTEELA